MKMLEELAARRRFGMRPGLAAIRGLARALGDPQRSFRAIHVAGTNGKGAVCAMLDAALGAGGYRVGRYTSPHLVALNERFFLEGAPIDDATLERHAAKVEDVLREHAHLEFREHEITFFEALTAVAYSLYAEAQVDFAILECGLGGRLDATNICQPGITIITRIGLDHCDWLGDTVEKIAAEKAGIIKPGIPVVLGDNSPAVRAVVESRAKALDAPCFYAPELANEGEIPADFSLAGSFNRENAITAIAALKVLSTAIDGNRRQSTAIGGNRLLSGLSRVVWPGRFQQVDNFIIDGAHNPPAAQALAESLKIKGFVGSVPNEMGSVPKKTGSVPNEGSVPKGAGLNLIFGACGDKEVDTVLKTLKPLVLRGLAVKTSNQRALPAAALARMMAEQGIPSAAYASLAAAITAVGDEPTLICGSLFLAGEALVALNAYPWSSSRFDPSESLREQSKAIDGRRGQSRAVDGDRWQSKAVDGSRDQSIEKGIHENDH